MENDHIWHVFSKYLEREGLTVSLDLWELSPKRSLEEISYLSLPHSFWVLWWTSIPLSWLSSKLELRQLKQSAIKWKFGSRLKCAEMSFDLMSHDVSRFSFLPKWSTYQQTGWWFPSSFPDSFSFRDTSQLVPKLMIFIFVCLQKNFALLICILCSRLDTNMATQPLLFASFSLKFDF